MTNLNQKGMLINLSISQWTGRKHDKSVSKEVADNHGTSTDAGRYNKSLVAKEALDAVKKAANKARTFHYENTLPWSNDGARILPAANFNAYSEKMREFKADFEGAAQEFFNNYDYYVSQARINLNGLYKDADYPDRWTLEKKFSFDTSINPLPTGDDFRVSLTQADADAIKSDIESRTQAATAAAMKDLWTRLYDNVQHMAAKLADADAVFRDSLINNICDLCGLLPRLNITDDPELEALRREVEAALCNYEPKELREDPDARKTAAKDAADLLEKMAGYMGKPPAC